MASPNFFSPGSPYLNHPLLTSERTASEIDYVLSQTALLPGARVLDVGCGPGRHSLELARRGYRLVGIDPSPAMIDSAVEAADQMPPDIKPKFIQVSGVEFTADQHFDAAICLFTTLGQMDDSGDNVGLLDSVYKALKPGGIFIIEVPNRDWVAANLKPHDRFGGIDEYTEIERRFDPDTNAVTETFTLVFQNNRHVYMLRYRLYSADELRNLVEMSGFEVTRFHGGYEAEPFEVGKPIILAVVQKS